MPSWLSSVRSLLILLREKTTLWGGAFPFFQVLLASLLKHPVCGQERETPAIQIQLEVSWGPKVYLHTLIIDHLAENEPSYSSWWWIWCVLILVYHRKKNLSLDVSLFYNWPYRMLFCEIGICVTRQDSTSWCRLTCSSSTYLFFYTYFSDF